MSVSEDTALPVVIAERKQRWLSRRFKQVAEWSLAYALLWLAQLLLGFVGAVGASSEASMGLGIPLPSPNVFGLHMHITDPRVLLMLVPHYAFIIPLAHRLPFWEFFLIVYPRQILGKPIGYFIAKMNLEAVEQRPESLVGRLIRWILWPLRWLLRQFLRAARWLKRKLTSWQLIKAIVRAVRWIKRKASNWRLVRAIANAARWIKCKKESELHWAMFLASVFPPFNPVGPLPHIGSPIVWAGYARLKFWRSFGVIAAGTVLYVIILYYIGAAYNSV